LERSRRLGGDIDFAPATRIGARKTCRMSFSLVTAALIWRGWPRGVTSTTNVLLLVGQLESANKSTTCPPILEPALSCQPFALGRSPEVSWATCRRTLPGFQHLLLAPNISASAETIRVLKVPVKRKLTGRSRTAGRVIWRELSADESFETRRRRPCPSSRRAVGHLGPASLGAHDREQGTGARRAIRPKDPE
jgi:hypothetical protein